MKPHLLDDWQQDRLRFPLIAQPKVDGVRGLNLTGNLTARSLKPFKNRHLTQLLSHPALIGFDGELAAGPNNHPDLCRMTSSATGTIDGETFITWWLFDYVTAGNRNDGYAHRLMQLDARRQQVYSEFPHFEPHLQIMPSKVIHSLEELEAFDNENLFAGFEGTVICGPTAAHKEGRAGKQLIKWRIKRFVDFEFLVDEIIEGEENRNESQINELGRSFRSSHQENKVANGMVGSMIGRTVGVVKDGDKVLFEPGQQVTVGAGRLSHDQRRHFFANQNEFKGHLHKAKFFPKGIKDKPRFPTWQSFRQREDM